MKRILLVWPYHRNDWIEVFREMEGDFEFHFIAYIDPLLDVSAHEHRPKHYHYWSDFFNAQEIIDKIKPEKIVFMSIDSALSISLNYVAKKRHIKTYILQHGIYTNYRDYRTRERFWRKSHVAGKIDAVKKEVKFSSGAFVARSVPRSNIFFWFPFLVHAFFLRKKGLYFANRFFSFEAKKPTFYICYSKANARIHEELDNPSKERFIFTGSPELDRYISSVAKAPIEGKYILHIDQAMAENSFGEETVTKESMITFYKSLLVLGEALGAKVVVKLHPESYQATWLPEQDKILYLRRTTDLSAYIQHAFLCTGFYSSLVIPAAYWNRVILFNVFYSYLQETLAKLPHVKVVPFFKFNPENLTLPDPRTDAQALESYFHKFDGKATQRIMEVLNG